MTVSSLWSRRYILAALMPACASLGVLALVGRVEATPLNTLESLDLPSPNTPITDSTGETISLADYAPTPLLVNFWASWCPPCIHELPALGRLDSRLAPLGMAVLLVGIDRKGRDFGEGFLIERGITPRHRAYDPEGTLARSIGVRAMPTSFLIGGTGRIIGKIEGIADWDDGDITAALIRLLGGHE